MIVFVFTIFGWFLISVSAIDTAIDWLSIIYIFRWTIQLTHIFPNLFNSRWWTKSRSKHYLQKKMRTDSALQQPMASNIASVTRNFRMNIFGIPTNSNIQLQDTKGLLNGPGQNNCFLNSAVQVSLSWLTNIKKITSEIECCFKVFKLKYLFVIRQITILGSQPFYLNIFVIFRRILMRILK